MMPDLMVDIETTGTDPSHAAIIQIAAVRFDFDTMRIGESFCASLTMPSNRHWDEDTRTWWMKNLEVYEAIVAEEQDAGQVWRSFVDWCVRTSSLAGDDRLWAKPISFEWPFLQSYGKQFSLDLPFHYRNAVDLNSFTRGMQRQPGAKPFDWQQEIPFVGDAHNAIDDVLHQIKIALTAKVMIPC